MRYKEILSEISYKEFYPKAFVNFREKYLPQVADASLYVNFTNAVSNNLDKSFSANPNHSDPIGLYGYPLDYVIKHPANITYGQTAQNLRVIRDMSKNKLDLQTLTEEQSFALLTRLGYENVKLRLTAARKKLSGMGGYSPGQVFWFVFKSGKTSGSKVWIANAEQTKLLRGLGFDAVEDRAKAEHSSIINGNEPEQIIFLTRGAFQVVEVISLRTVDNADRMMTRKREFMKRLPGLVSQALGDPITGKNEAESEENMTYYTRDGKRITIASSTYYSFQHGHRGEDTGKSIQVTITLQGPGFAPIRKTFEAKADFETMATEIAALYRDRTETDSQDRHSLENDYAPDVGLVCANLEAIAKKLKLPLTIPSAFRARYRYRECFQKVHGEHHGYSVQATKPSILATLTKSAQKLLKPEEANALVKLWTKLAAQKGVGKMDLIDPKAAARSLGVGISAPEQTADSAPTPTLDLGSGNSLQQKGTKLLWSNDGKVREIAEVENLDLKPSMDRGNYDQFVNKGELVPHAEAIAGWFNDRHYTMSGYVDFVRDRLGVVYRDGSWLAEQTTFTKLAEFGSVTIEKINRDYMNIVAKWPSGTVEMLTLKEKKIDGVSDSLRRFAGSIYGSGYSSSTDSIWQEMRKNGFDPKKFFAEQGWAFTMNASDAFDAFGAIANRDNGKIGSSIGEVKKPIGDYAGLPVFTYLTGAAYAERHRMFLTPYEGKLRVLMKTDPDWSDGSTDAKILYVHPDLTDEMKRAVNDLIAEKRLAVPVKFRPLLKMAKPSIKTK